MGSFYTTEISKYSPLSREEEKEIAIRYKKEGHDVDANKLITSNLRYVVRVANKLSVRYRDVDISELIQEGNIGLMKALEKFEPEKGFKLITYANQWILTYMKRFIAKNNNICSATFENNYERLFMKSQGKTKAIHDIDIGTYEETNFNALYTNCTAEDRLAEKNWLRSVHEITDDVNEKYSFVIKNRLISDVPLKLDDIAEHFNISRSGAHDLEKRIKDNLKKRFMESPDIMEFLGEDTIKVNVEMETVRRKKKKIGHIIDEFDFDLAKELLKKETYKTVAEKMGISRGYLHTIINRKGKGAVK
jgi:RNA polymerase sigma-32 factor